jgi:pre-rRNA-processing protein TSR4
MNTDYNKWAKIEKDLDDEDKAEKEKEMFGDDDDDDDFEDEEEEEQKDDEENNDTSDDEEDWEDDIQLGFVEEASASVPTLHDIADCSKWDGGRVGGKPSWLDPTQVPKADALNCPRCSTPMPFLLQIYAPLDTEDTAHAYHRAVYIFCCKNGPCVEKGGIKALRCSLPQNNPIYAAKSTDPAPEITLSPSCAVCGKFGNSKCSKCKQLCYCCKAHQVEHWKNGHKKMCGKETSGAGAGSVGGAVKAGFLGETPTIFASNFKQFDISIDGEPGVEEEDASHKERAAELAAKTAVDDIGIKDGDVVGEGQAKYDPTQIGFMKRISRAPSQCLRYLGGWEGYEDSHPQWSHSAQQAQPFQVPPCEKCGAERLFEFQIMPQLLYFLGVDNETSVLTDGTASDVSRKALDFGTVVVYCCPSCCASDDPERPYVEEFVWVQPPGPDAV